MTAGHRFETIRIARNEVARPVPSPRRLAGVITGGAAVLALVLATALPARAGDRGNDLAKALIAALVVGAIIHETKKDKKPAPQPAPVDTTPRIPAVCALEFEGERQSVTVYPESCLLDEGVTARLPRYCAKDARIYGEWDRIYGEKCLGEAGFRLPKAHY